MWQRLCDSTVVPFAESSHLVVMSLMFDQRLHSVLQNRKKRMSNQHRVHRSTFTNLLKQGKSRSRTIPRCSQVFNASKRLYDFNKPIYLIYINHNFTSKMLLYYNEFSNIFVGINTRTKIVSYVFLYLKILAKSGSTQLE